GLMLMTLTASALSKRQAGVNPPEPLSRPYACSMLSITLLGRMAVERDGHELPVPTSRRAWSLLAYLALHPGPQPRGELAARFWPDVLDSSARASLRSAVWALRRVLEPFAPELLVAGREDVGLSAEIEVSVDVLVFATLLAEGR